MSKPLEADGLMCPSAHETHIGAKVFGVQVKTSSGDTTVGYLPEAYPVTDQLLALAGPAAPTEALRIAAPCIKCEHHDGNGCRLAGRVATMLDPAVGTLPRCAIRSNCLWFRQEGREACLRCPQIISRIRSPNPFEQVLAGVPASRTEDAVRRNPAPSGSAGS
jgi:hypothetical protein